MEILVVYHTKFESSEKPKMIGAYDPNLIYAHKLMEDIGCFYDNNYKDQQNQEWQEIIYGNDALMRYQYIQKVSNELIFNAEAKNPNELDAYFFLEKVYM